MKYIRALGDVIELEGVKEVSCMNMGELPCVKFEYHDGEYDIDVYGNDGRRNAAYTQAYGMHAASQLGEKTITSE